MQEFSKEEIYKINLYAILEDIQDQLLTELRPNLKHGLKYMSGNASKHTKAFIRECDRVFKGKNTEDFGITSDNLRKIIDEIYLDN